MFYAARSFHIRSGSMLRSYILRQQNGVWYGISVKRQPQGNGNKTIRFPIHLIDQIEQAISDSDQDITFSSFVIQACEYALDHMDAPSEEHN